MIEARRRLIGMAREFVERDLAGLVSWGDVQFETPEPLPKSPGGRRHALGKYRERVVIRFGRYTLDVKSPADEPPLGSVKLMDRDIVAVDGTIDIAVWQRAGQYIKEKHHGR